MSDAPPPEPKLVTRVEPVPAPVPRRAHRPRPGFWEALLLTFGYWLVLIGAAVGVVAAAVAYRVAVDGLDAVKSPGGTPGTVGAMPPDVVDALAWAFPVGYAAGLAFTLIVVRRYLGRGWVRAFGLRRRPWAHLGLAVVALPGFVVLSDVIATALGRWVDGPLFRTFGGHPPDSGGLAEVYAGYPGWFVVLAVGVGPGVVEELWCRGFLGRSLVGRYGWVWGVGLASLFFGLLHAWPPSYVLTTAVMGAGLHFAYVASRSLWVPILLHLLNNGFAGLAAVGAVPDLAGRALATHPDATTAMAAAGLLMAGLAAWSARPGAGRRPNPVFAGMAVLFNGLLVFRALVG